MTNTLFRTVCAFFLPKHQAEEMLPVSPLQEAVDRMETQSGKGGRLILYCGLGPPRKHVEMDGDSQKPEISATLRNQQWKERSRDVSE